MAAVEQRRHWLVLTPRGSRYRVTHRVRAYQLARRRCWIQSTPTVFLIAADQRDYSMVGPMLAHFGVTDVELLTNNPKKVEALEGLTVVKRHSH